MSLLQISLLNIMLFVDLGVNVLFQHHAIIWPWWWNSFLVFFYLTSLSSFLAKGKISKSVGLFLSHIGPKWCWPIKLQDFKSNISLEQSDEIVYFFTCWCQKLRVDRKILGWVWSEMCGCPGHKVNGWMNGWTELNFCMLIKIQES